VRENRRDLYIPCKMTTNNAGWSQGWFYLRNYGGLLPAYTGKILRDKLDDWGYGVSPPERQAKLGVYTDALRRLADKGLTMAVRPGAAVLLIDIEYSRVRDSSRIYLTSLVTIRIGVELAAVQRKLPDCVVGGIPTVFG